MQEKRTVMTNRLHMPMYCVVIAAVTGCAAMSSDVDSAPGRAAVVGDEAVAAASACGHVELAARHLKELRGEAKGLPVEQWDVMVAYDSRFAYVYFGSPFTFTMPLAGPMAGGTWNRLILIDRTSGRVAYPRPE